MKGVFVSFLAIFALRWKSCLRRWPQLLLPYTAPLLACVAVVAIQWLVYEGLANGGQVQFPDGEILISTNLETSETVNRLINKANESPSTTDYSQQTIPVLLEPLDEPPDEISSSLSIDAHVLQHEPRTYAGGVAFDKLKIQGAADSNRKQLIADIVIMPNLTHSETSPLDLLKWAMRVLSNEVAIDSDDNSIHDHVDIQTRVKPLPTTTDHHFAQAMFQFLGPPVLMNGLQTTFVEFAIDIVDERERGLKNLMHVSGLSHGIYWTATIAAQLALYITTLLPCAATLYGGQVAVLTRFPMTLAALSVVFGLSMLGMVLLASCCFSRVETARKFLGGYVQLSLVATMTLLSHLVDSDYAGIGSIFPQIGFLAVFSEIGEKMKLPPTVTDDLDALYDEKIAMSIGMMVLGGVVWIGCLSVCELFDSQRSLVWKRLQSRQAMTTTTLPQPSEQQPLFVRNLTKVFGSEVAVNNVTLFVHSGECVGLMGPNGAGKSTLLRMMCGIEPPTSGDCYVLGCSIYDGGSVVRQHLGYCPQQATLFDEITPTEHVRLFRNIKGQYTSKEAEMDALERLGLTQFSDIRCKTLSGGNRKRTSIAVSTAVKPKVLVMDEPLSGLDPKGRELAIDLIAELSKVASVIVTSHSLHDAEKLCTRIVWIKAGSIGKTE